MLQDWKTYVLHQGKSLGGRREEYVGIYQDDDESSPEAPRGINKEQKGISLASIQICACFLAAVMGVLFGVLLGATTLKPRECDEKMPKASAAHSFEDLLPKSKYFMVSITTQCSW
jgi:hypothetical protein